MTERERESLRKYLVEAPSVAAASRQFGVARHTLLGVAVGVSAHGTVIDRVRRRMRELRIT